MDDVLIVGAGPAGAVAATVLARAGARVRLLDRATFPRDKLCGDTLNPGTLARSAHASNSAGLLERRRTARRRHAGRPAKAAWRSKAAIHGGLRGRSIRRRDLDWALLQAGDGRRRAVRAWRHRARGAGRYERRRCASICGVSTAEAGESARGSRAPVTIAADGRRSTLAFGLGLARHPRAAAALGDRRVLRAGVERHRRRSARCTSGAAATSASRRFPAD